MLNNFAKSCGIVAGVVTSIVAGAANAESHNATDRTVSFSYRGSSPFISPKSHASNPKVYGKTYAKWAAKWWKWAASFPVDTNPIADETGELCDIGQSGPVWFLAGTLGATGVKRECTIPAGKALFYPVINAAWVDAPGDEALSDEEVRWIVTTMTGGGDLGCQISSTLGTISSPTLGDWGLGYEQSAPVTTLGRPIVRAQSPKVRVDLPADNIFGVPAGVNDRLIAEGYWVMLPPLKPGEHVLNLHGAQCVPAVAENEEPIVDQNGEQLLEKTFETEVTYYLDVRRKRRPRHHHDRR